MLVKEYLVNISFLIFLVCSVDCGTPPQIPGADYGDYQATTYQSTFLFGCKDETFRVTGESSKKTNIVTCMEDGTWDFGTLRCEEPVSPGNIATFHLNSQTILGPM